MRGTAAKAEPAQKGELAPEIAALYAPPKGRPVIIEAPPMRFLMVDGAGDPNTAPAYQKALEALYGVAYTIKFALKREQGLDVRVMPLEGLWWARDMAAFSLERKDDWLWTMLIAQPEVVTRQIYERAVAQMRTKKAPTAIERIRLETFHEGLAAQVLYLGPYAEEGPTIARLHSFIQESGYVLSGRHHEIYLGDPRRAAPEKLRTIIRQPMRAADR